MVRGKGHVEEGFRRRLVIFDQGEAECRSEIGYEREHKTSKREENRSDESAYIAVHEISTIQLSLNEFIVQLSPDAEADIKILRKDRSFSDLLSFLDKYGA